MTPVQLLVNKAGNCRKQLQSRIVPGCARPILAINNSASVAKSNTPPRAIKKSRFLRRALKKSAVDDRVQPASASMRLFIVPVSDIRRHGEWLLNDDHKRESARLHTTGGRWMNKLNITVRGAVKLQFRRFFC
jgi:hypothetical protein